MRNVLIASAVSLMALAPAVHALEIVLQDGVDGYGGTSDCGLYAPRVVEEINYGVSRGFGAGINRWNEPQVTLVRFDLSELPRGLHVQAARLELYTQSELYPYRDIRLQAAPLTAANAPWAEGENDGTRVPVPGTACWAWLAQGQTRWTGEAGLRAAGIEAGLGSVADVKAKGHHWLRFEIPPDLIRRWLSDPASNGGWRLYPEGDGLGKGDTASILLSEHADDPSLRPRLVLTVADDPAVAAALAKMEAARSLVALSAGAEGYARAVAKAGAPPRAQARLATVHAGLARLREFMDGWSSLPDAAAPVLAHARSTRHALAEARGLLCRDRAASHNENLGLPADFALGVATSMDKVFRRDALFEGRFTTAVTIEAAGNEHEAAQIIVIPVDRDLTGVTWGVEPAPPIRLTVAPVGYVKGDNPELVTAESPSEWWPDPILDFLDTSDCPAGEVQPLWVSAYVPPGTQAGIYTSKLTVSASGCEAKSVELRVRVFGFDVPREQHLKTVWGMNEANFARFYGDTYGESLAWKYFQLFLDHRMAPADLYRSKPTGKKGEDSVYHLASVDALKRLRAAGSSWWNVGYVVAPKHMPKEFSNYEEYLQACVLWFGDELKRVRAAGWPEGSYGIYFLDETKEFGKLARAAEIMREHFPGVPLMTTGYDRSYGVDKKSPVADLLDIWVPLTPRYQEDQAKILDGRKLGKKAWWYVCVGPRGKRELNWFTQYPAIRARLLMGAAAWKYQPDGFLYYRVAGWIYHDRPITAGPMTDWMPRYHPNLPDGDGQIICAGPSGPLTTVRLENIRDGMEDYEYWWLLQQRVRVLGDAVDSRSNDVRGLCDVPEELLRDLRTYSEDPDVLYRTRRNVAEAIERVAPR